MSDPANPARRGGRGERRASRMKPNHEMLPQLTGQLPLTEPMDAEQIEQIDDASLSILEEVGVVFRDDIALEDWRRVGADVCGETVHLDRVLVKSLISTIPSDITLHARNSEKSVRLGGRNSIFVPMTGAPYLRDLDDVRRSPTLDDLATFHKLSHMLPAIHLSLIHI